MNRLEAMSVLLAVIDAGSLSAAGRRLGMPLATVNDYKIMNTGVRIRPD